MPVVADIVDQHRTRRNENFRADRYPSPSNALRPAFFKRLCVSLGAVYLRKVDALRRKAEADVAQVSQRLRESEQRREELTDLKFAHEAELRELRGRSEASEAGREAAANDARELREANRAYEARAFESEREVERLRMQVAALKQQVCFGED